jgi:hypothetical protein
MPRIECLPPLGLIYNVRPEEYCMCEPDEPLEFDSDEYVWSVEQLPPSGSQEFERRDIVPALSTLIRQYLADINCPSHNEFKEEVFGQYSIGAFTSSRELRFFLDHPDVFQPELIRRVQALLADRFPLWRIVPQYNERVIGVYPEGVWLGKQAGGHWEGDALVHGRIRDDDREFAAWSARVQDLATTLRLKYQQEI